MRWLLPLNCYILATGLTLPLTTQGAVQWCDVGPMLIASALSLPLFYALARTARRKASELHSNREQHLLWLSLWGLTYGVPALVSNWQKKDEPEARIRELFAQLSDANRARAPDHEPNHTQPKSPRDEGLDCLKSARAAEAGLLVSLGLCLVAIAALYAAIGLRMQVLTDRLPVASIRPTGAPEAGPDEARASGSRALDPFFRQSMLKHPSHDSTEDC